MNGVKDYYFIIRNSNGCSTGSFDIFSLLKDYDQCVIMTKSHSWKDSLTVLRELQKSNHSF